MKMDNVYYVWDASAFINGFTPQNKYNFTSSKITSEIKDIKASILFNSLLDDNQLIIQEPTSEAIKELEKTITKSGDDLRLSAPDMDITALAIDLNKNHKTKLVTDDYSIQNVLKILEIPYQSIITKGIEQTYSWKKSCPSCGKQYSSDYQFEDCEVCGSILYKKRTKGKK